MPVEIIKLQCQVSYWCAVAIANSMREGMEHIVTDALSRADYITNVEIPEAARKYGHEI